MLGNDFNEHSIKSTLLQLNANNEEIKKIVSGGNITTECIHYENNYYGGLSHYNIMISIPAKNYVNIKSKIEMFKNLLIESFEDIMDGIDDEKIANIIIKPIIKQYINFSSVNYSQSEIINLIETLQADMISVATGGKRIQEINSKYKHSYNTIDNIFAQLGIENPNQYDDLWKWYTRWKAEDLKTYKSRRDFISEMYFWTLDSIRKSDESESKILVKEEITGWVRVDRTIVEIKNRLEEAKNEEHYQSIGLLSRELVISLAQAVYNPKIHQPQDDVIPSDTDAKRMLESYFAFKINGSSNEEIRKYAKSTLSLANSLVHKRTATYKQAALCTLAVTTLLNIIKLIEEETF